jgi:aminopeptidase N
MTDNTAPLAKYLKDYQAPDYTFESVDLVFDLSNQKTTVQTTIKVSRNGEHSRSLVLDGNELVLNEVMLDGDVLSADHYSVDDNSLTITNLPNTFTLTTKVTIDPENNTSLEGLYKTDGSFCTQCEAEGFRRITYFLDRPDVLCTYTTKIIGNKADMPYMLSNGNKIDSGDLPDGKHWVLWQDPFNKPCYLFALVAGQFDLLSDTYTTMSGREVKLELYVDEGNLDKADHAMSSLKKSMKWDEDTFGLEYDLDIYMIVAVDFFNMGAMENKGLNVFNSKCVLANPATATDTDYHYVESVIGHEYFHNWTGNRVTCRDWFQLSLKEGLTVFRDQQFSSDMGSAVVNRVDAVKVIRAHQFAEDAGPMAHPIRPEKVIEMNNFYTVTVYNKGAEVIRMMHSLLGVANFRKGMDLYFERHDGTAVTCDDFVSAMQDASGVDLTQFRRWYNQAGTPVLTINTEFDGEKQTYTLNVNQNNGEGKPP